MIAMMTMMIEQQYHLRAIRNLVAETIQFLTVDLAF